MTNILRSRKGTITTLRKLLIAAVIIAIVVWVLLKYVIPNIESGDNLTSVCQSSGLTYCSSNPECNHFDDTRNNDWGGCPSERPYCCNNVAGVGYQPDDVIRFIINKGDGVDLIQASLVPLKKDGKYLVQVWIDNPKDIVKCELTVTGPGWNTDQATATKCELKTPAEIMNTQISAGEYTIRLNLYDADGVQVGETLKASLIVS